MNGWRVGRWAVLGAGVWAASAAAAPPLLSGIYEVGKIGLVEFKVEGKRTIGRYRIDGECAFSRDKQVISGEFESGVFVGTVALCQAGAAACKEKTFPFMGIWHDDRLTAEVRVDPDCTAPGLTGKRLVIAPASTAQKKRAVEQVDAADVARGAKKISDTELKELGQEALRRLQAGDSEAAREAFSKVLSFNPDNWRARTGLANALNGLKQYHNAAAEFRKAQADADIAGDASKLELQELHYNLACPYTQLSQYSDAIAELRQAVDLGFRDVEQLQSDPDLARLRGEPDFRRLIERVKKAPKR